LGKLFDLLVTLKQKKRHTQ